MNEDAIIARAAEVVNKAKSICICLPQSPSLDTVASGLALYIGLLKQGKNVSIACSREVSKDFDLMGLEKIQQSVSTEGKNLVISFPYVEGSVDKVTTNVEGDRFDLLIVPEEGYEAPDPSKVKFTTSGGKIDALIILDTPALSDLGDLYKKHEDKFKGLEIINMDRHLTNSDFGTVNLLDKKTSSSSEIILALLKRLNIEIDSDMATNLYAGIVHATANFSSFSVNQNTFEACASLLKAGAVKKVSPTTRIDQVISEPADVTTTYPSQPTPRVTPEEEKSPEPHVEEATFELFGAGDNDVKSTPIFEEVPQDVTEKKGTVEVAKIEKKEEKEETPNDWLKPKIFKGRSLL